MLDLAFIALGAGTLGERNLLSPVLGPVEREFYALAGSICAWSSLNCVRNWNSTQRRRVT